MGIKRGKAAIWARLGAIMAVAAVALAAVGTAAVPAYGAQGLTIGSSLTATASIDSNRVVTVSGVLTSGAGRQVSVMITDPKGKVEYVGDTTAGTGGKFTLSYTMHNTTTGTYNVEVGAEGVPYAAKTSFAYGAIEASVDASNLVTVKGNANVESGQTVSIEITDPNDGYEYLGNAVTTADGAFSLSYIMFRSVTGIYNVTAGFQGMQKPLVTSFAYGNAAEVHASINENKQVTVSGFMGSLPGERVAVKITDPKDSYEYIGDTTTGAGGRFSISYTMLNATAGIYDVTVGSPMLVTPLLTSFTYSPPSADLKMLAISEGTLSPAFASGTTAYTANVNNSVSTVTVTPTAVDPLAVIKVNGTTVANGSASGAIALNVGSNTIKVDVTSSDEVTTKTYTITVTRAGFYAGSGGGASPKMPTPTATPTATPPGGWVADNSPVKLSDMTSGATIYYTINAGTPNESSSSVTSGESVTISGAAGSTVTVRAMASAPGDTDSTIATFTYTILGWIHSGLADDPVQSLASVGQTVYAGTDGDGVWTESGGSWSRGGLGGADVTSLADVSGTVYAGTAGKTVSGDVYVLNGAWEKVTAGGADLSSLFTYYTANVYSLAGVGQTVYVGTDQGVLYPGENFWGGVGEIAPIYSLANFNGTLYAGTDNSVYQWNGTQWTLVKETSSTVHSLAYVNGTIYAGTDHGVQVVSGSAGTSGLTGDTVYSLAYVNETLYAGTGNGVYQWNSGAQEWTQVDGTTWPDNTTAYSLTVANDGTLYAGTGNGVWVYQ